MKVQDWDLRSQSVSSNNKAGKISLESEPGQGSRFTFTLQSDPKYPGHILQTVPAVSLPRPAASREKPLILVVDDEASRPRASGQLLKFGISDCDRRIGS